MKNKFVKVMFGTKSGADKNLEYKINEVNVSKIWNPTEQKGKNFGGFNFSTEDKIIRWLHRGDTIYDVEIPEDAEMIDVVESATPHGVLRANKIIIKNPKKITDEMALDFYNKSTIPEIAYYKTLGVVSIMGYEKTALKILKDKVNKKNIDIVLEEWSDFIRKEDRVFKGIVKFIDELLREVKSDLLISRYIDKEPLIENITDDKIINLTGESGSGKSFFTKQWTNNDNYIIIDTDILFSDKDTDKVYILDLRKIFMNKFSNIYKDSLIYNFDECYKIILEYFRNTEKTIIIDSAQYRNIKDVSILKGQVIIMRTCIDTCYERCINRYKHNNPNYTEEELKNYKQKKYNMYYWYKSINEFIKKLDSYRYEKIKGKQL